MGASPEELDSIKELIHFDHVYYKQEGDSAADVVMQDAPAAAAAVASPQDGFLLSASIPPSPSSCPSLIGPPSPPTASHAVVFTPASPATSVVEVEDTVVIIEDSNDSAPLNLNMVSPTTTASSGGVLPGQTLSTSTFKMIPSPSALSTETGYESAVSPLSDCSLRGEDSFFEESAWEDPLPELFPALV